MRGAEAARLGRESANPDAANRTFFYIDTGTGIRSESGVGAYPHVWKLNNLYDMRTDPQGSWTMAVELYTQFEDRANHFESEVFKTGFDGYCPGAAGKMPRLHFGSTRCRGTSCLPRKAEAQWVVVTSEDERGTWMSRFPLVADALISVDSLQGSS